MAHDGSMSYVPRRREQELIDLLGGSSSPRNVILIEGVRQVGKTTLAERAIQRVGLPTTALNLEEQTLMRSRIDETMSWASSPRPTQRRGRLQSWRWDRRTTPRDRGWRIGPFPHTELR